MLDPTPVPSVDETASQPPLVRCTLLTISQAAKLLGISTGTLRNWDRNGRLRAYRNPMTDYRLYDRLKLKSLLRKGLTTPPHVN